MPYVNVDVDLSDIDTDDLVSELEYRQANFINTDINDIELLESIFQKRRTGQDYSSELDQLIFIRLGRIS